MGNTELLGQGNEIPSALLVLLLTELLEGGLQLRIELADASEDLIDGHRIFAARVWSIVTRRQTTPVLVEVLGVLLIELVAQTKLQLEVGHGFSGRPVHPANVRRKPDPAGSRLGRQARR
jgi:hypothetical protein